MSTDDHILAILLCFALEVTEQLSKVLGLAISIRPSVVCVLPLWLGRFSISWLLVLWDILSIFTTITVRLCWLFCVLHYGLLDSISSESSGHLLVLKTDDANHLADATFDGKELVHEPQLEAVLVRIELGRVAETLKHDETLVSAVGGNLLLKQLHYEAHVEKSGRVTVLFKWINKLSSSTEVHLLHAPRLLESDTELRLSQDLTSDELVHRQVKHIVFDGEVGASSVDINTLFVIHKDDLDREL